jgi:periplasmic protein CpxP/Spy
MNAETAKIVETELKQFAADLNLSDAQKTQLRAGLEDAREKLDAIREKHPDATRADFIAKFQEVRGSLRERVVKFFTPEQLVKWDAEVAKAKAFLGHSINT